MNEIKKTTQIRHVKEKCLDCWVCKKINGVWTCPWGLIPWLSEDRKFVECNGFIDRLPKIAPARAAFEKEKKKILR